jgi:hypothetical protein
MDFPLFIDKINLTNTISHGKIVLKKKNNGTFNRQSCLIQRQLGDSNKTDKSSLLGNSGSYSKQLGREGKNANFAGLFEN